jgi:hypothetical protein
MISPRFEPAVEPEREYWTREARQYAPYIFSPDTWVYKLSKPHNVADQQKEFCPDCFATERIVELKDGCCPWCTFEIVNLSRE